MFKHIAILVPAVAKSFHANAMTNTTEKTAIKRKTPACNSVYVAIAGEVVNRRFVLLRNFVLNGKERADYGKNLIQELSGLLTKEFGKGYSATNLKQMRAFFLSY